MSTSECTENYDIWGMLDKLKLLIIYFCDKNKQVNFQDY